MVEKKRFTQSCRYNKQCNLLSQTSKSLSAYCQGKLPLSLFPKRFMVFKSQNTLLLMHEIIPLLRTGTAYTFRPKENPNFTSTFNMFSISSCEIQICDHGTRVNSKSSLTTGSDVLGKKQGENGKQVAVSDKATFKNYSNRSYVSQCKGVSTGCRYST